MKGISAVIIVHNEDSIIEESLKSLKGTVDEIVVVHDGPCKDKSISISKKYTKKVYTTKHTGRSAFNFITALKKTKYDWILKLDADESLSKELQRNIKDLTKEEDTDAFSFIHPLWDGEKTITKKWPRKMVLVRKEKISYLAFPGFDANIPHSGKTRKTDYVIYHKPLKNQDVGFKGFREKVLKRYAKSQARFLLKDFSDFETYNYPQTNFPLKIRIRRIMPILTNIPYALLVFFKQLFIEGAWREGRKGLFVVLKTFIYNIYLGYLMQIEKFKKK